MRRNGGDLLFEMGKRRGGGVKVASPGTRFVLGDIQSRLSWHKGKIVLFNVLVKLF